MSVRVAARTARIHPVAVLAILLCFVTPTAHAAPPARPSGATSAQTTAGPITPVRQITKDSGQSARASLSANGQVVAFESSAADLVTGDTNGRIDVFVYNRGSGQIGLASNGPGPEDGDSTHAQLSADGNFVAFQSSASNQTPGDTNGVADIFVYNLRTGGRARVSVSSAGRAANRAALNPALSADGQIVAFESAANSLVFGDGNERSDIFVHDRATGRTARASVNDAGNGGTGDSANAALSSDGRYVAFESAAANLVSGDGNGRRDIFVRDRIAQRTVRVSVGASGGEGDADSSYPAISGDGRFVTFESTASTLVAGVTPGRGNIFLHDRDPDADGVYDEPGQVTTALVSRVGAGDANGDSAHATISADGRQIAFFSFASDLAAGDLNGQADVFVQDRESGKVRRVSQAPGGADASGSSFDPALSADGQLTAFHSFAGNLGGGTSGTTRDIFVADTPAWLAILYLAGDDIPPDQAGQVGLSAYLRELHDRLRAAEPNRALSLVVLFDGSEDQDSALLYRGPGAGGLTAVAPGQLPEWFAAELDTGSPATLQQFTAWARETFFGSAHTMLAIVDHGGGWAPDQSAIGQPRGTGMMRAGSWSGIALDASAEGGAGSSIATRELRLALSDGPPLDLLFLDACLMGMVEVAYEIQPHAGFLVAGSNQLWAQLPYQSYLAPSALTPATTPEGLARSIVERYNSPPRFDEPFTIAAIRTEALTGLVAEVEGLAVELRARIGDPGSRGRLLAAYGGALKYDYDSSFSLDPTDAFVDLGDLVAQLRLPEHSIAPEVSARAEQVELRLGQAVVAARRQSGKSVWAEDAWDFTRASGLSIYLPLGEKDCRATGLPTPPGGQPAEAPCQAPPGYPAGAYTIEPQLKYYARGDQLRFSAPGGAPTWAALLVDLDAAVPLRSPDRPPMTSPYQGAPQTAALTTSGSVYLPLAQR